MIRILHSVSNMDRAGIETMLMNYYRHIDREKFQFDFLVNKPKPGDYDEQIRAMGGRIFKSPGLSPDKFPGYMRFMKDLLCANPEIKVLHAHNEGMAYYALEGAKRAGLGVRIAHAHNTHIIRDYKYPLKILCKSLIPFAATDYWSCGRDAGIYYFGKKRWSERGVLMPNAIETEKFRFCAKTRESLRQEYSLGEKLVIGNVGRFNLQKNHTKLLDIFAEILKIRNDAHLVLIGEGELEESMKEKAHKLGIYDNVSFLGLRSDVDKWYQAMDVFVMPSLFEGLPVVGIEAQASGLACIFSDEVTDEVVLSPASQRISLRESNSFWAEKILAAAGAAAQRNLGIKTVSDAGYDIAVEAQKLQSRYETLIKTRSE